MHTSNFTTLASYIFIRLEFTVNLRSVIIGKGFIYSFR